MRSSGSPAGPRRRSVRVAYPGLWVRPDVYATHGHYLDCHLTVPTLERLSVGAMSRLLGRPASEFDSRRPTTRRSAPRCSPGATPSPATPHRCGAQRDGHGAPPGARSEAVADGAPGAPRGSRAAATRGCAGARIAAAFPVAVAALNRAGLGPLRADVSDERAAPSRAAGDGRGRRAARLSATPTSSSATPTGPGRCRATTRQSGAGAPARASSTPAAGPTRAPSSARPPARARTGRDRA